MNAASPMFLSVFSGIGGFDLGLERSGWRCAGQIEVDPFCTRVLARHWPNVPRWGDVRTVNADILGCASEPSPRFACANAERQAGGSGAARVDLLCGGFPCQDLSVAGRRAGLSAARSGLFFEFVRLAGELRPRWILLENVPGLFSSNGGRDFALILHTLDELRYGVSWRVLDSRYFGVPQRRRRVFLVGHLGAACPSEVLFESEGGERDSAPSGEAGEGVAYDLAASARGTGDEHGNDWNTTYALTARQTRLANEDTFVIRTNQTGAQGRNVWTDIAPTLDTLEPAAVLPIAFSNRALDTGSATERLRSRSHGALPMVAEAYQCQGTNVGPMGALRRGNGNETGGVPFASAGSAVRRLTPTECERLQAFPDGWTCLCDIQPYSTANYRCPDSPRYAALGNAVTVNVITWLGQRLLAAHTERMP